MKYEYYKELSISDDFEIYDFVSSGIKGNIRKRARFEFIPETDTYNFAFGDLVDDDIDDYSITDNKDMAKILATLAIIVRLFLETYPDRIVSFRGSTSERTRLYRMAIGNNLNELLNNFTIYGVKTNGSINIFVKNEDYYAFLVRKKI